MAMYEYVYKKLSAKNHSVVPAPYNYAGTEPGYTVGNVKNPFLNDGKLLLGHKIINPEHIYKALNIVPDIGPVDEMRKDVARHCADDDFDTAEDAALAFVLRYLAQAQSRGGGYYSGICSRTYITLPENIRSVYPYYFCPHKTVPSNLEISTGSFPQFDIEAFVFTDDTPTKWPLSYRQQIVNYYIKSDRLKAYYIRGKNLYCWTNLLTEPPGAFLCSLNGLEQTEVIEGPGNIADKYYANDSVKIRATPNGQQIDGNRIFRKGAIVRIHLSKETQKVDGSDNTWIKVYYDGSNVGWIAKEFLEQLPQAVAGYNFKYNWSKSQYVTQDFEDKAVGVANSLGIDPDDLMAVMAFESNGCNPAQKNMAGGSAVGLVQFMPDVAEELNTTTSDLLAMSGVEQLDYVFGYFYPYKGQLITLGDVYMRVLWPDGVGKNDSYVLYSKGSSYYAANAGLDANNDGNITKKEATQVVIDKRQEYI